MREAGDDVEWIPWLRDGYMGVYVCRSSLNLLLEIYAFYCR